MDGSRAPSRMLSTDWSFPRLNLPSAPSRPKNQNPRRWIIILLASLSIVVPFIRTWLMKDWTCTCHLFSCPYSHGGPDNFDRIDVFGLGCCGDYWNSVSSRLMGTNFRFNNALEENMVYNLW